MFSEKSKKNADACRFCWMCRHLCPVQLVTGKEANTPRAKGLLVSLIERGFEMEKSTAETMYECLLCGACTNDCVTGFEPPVFIREARAQTVVNELVPSWAQKILDRIMETGNVYGAKEAKVHLDGYPESGDILVWLGATARYEVPEVVEAFLSLCRKAGVDVAVLKDEPASGVALGDLAGYIEDVRQQAQQAAAAIGRTGAKQVVVLDSYDASAFRHEYRDWGIALPEVVTATAFVAELLKQGKLQPQKEALAVTYHDGSRLARDLDEHQPARDILAAMGCEIYEMFQNRRLAKAAGSSLMGQMRPELSVKFAEGRWADAKRTTAKTLIAACPQSTEALRRAVPEGYEYHDIFVLLNQRC